MTSKLKPCGTVAAYRRHLRNGETPCDECKRAVREHEQARRAAKRAEAVQTAREAVPEPTDEIDRRAILLEVLSELRGHLNTAPPQSVAAIAKQVRDTVDALEAGEGEQAQANPIDEIARRREARLRARRSS